MLVDRIGRWSFWFLILAVATTAMVFAILCWNDCQAKRPHRCLERSDIFARGDIFAQGGIRTKQSLRVDQDCQMRGKARINSLAVHSFALDEVRRVVDTSPIQMNKHFSTCRIDTPGSNVLTVQLPSISEAPYQTFHIFVSKVGANNVVNVKPGSSDCYVGPQPISGGGHPDHLELVNDGLSTWFAAKSAWKEKLAPFNNNDGLFV